MSVPIVMHVYNLGKREVKELKCQGYGDKTYCNNGAVYYPDGTVHYESLIASPLPLTKDELEALKRKEIE